MQCNWLDCRACSDFTNSFLCFLDHCNCLQVIASFCYKLLYFYLKSIFYFLMCILKAGEVVGISHLLVYSLNGWMLRRGSDQSQELETPAGSSTLVAGVQVLDHHPMLSQEVGLEVEQLGLKVVLRGILLVQGLGLTSWPQRWFLKSIFWDQCSYFFFILHWESVTLFLITHFVGDILIPEW